MFDRRQFQVLPIMSGFSLCQEISKLMKDNSETRWGNRFGVILLPVFYHKSGNDPLEYLKRAKVMVDRKKQSLEAYFSYRIGDLTMSLLGPKV